MKILLIFLALLFGTAAFIRLAPSDPSRWNIDPLTASDPGRGGVLLLPGAVNFTETPTALMARLDRIMRTQPRASVLAGTTNSLQSTYIVRSKILGFPDYITFRILPVSVGGSTLAVLSRLRFGSYDFGVNQDRLDRILKLLRAP